MICSMTGFGSATRETDAFRATATARSLNNRFLEINVSTSRDLAELESDIRRLAQERIRRGRVDVALRAELLQASVRVAISRPLVAALVQKIRELGVEHGLTTDVRAAEILQLPGVVEIFPDNGDAWSSLREELMALVRQALDGLGEMRRAEGARLEADLCERLNAIERATDELCGLNESSKDERREQLSARTAALRDELGLQETRLYQEIAKLVERYDVNEEVVRLRSHVAQAHDTLASKDPSGRRLEFLAQEMVREANTVGAKALSSQMVQVVVDIKSDIEKLREQVQNVE